MFALLCFLLFALFSMKGTWHWALFSGPMFLIPNIFLCKKLYFVKRLLSDFCFLCQKWKLTRRHCVRKCRFRLKKKKSIVKDNRDVFFWAQKCTKIFRWWEKKNCNPGYLRCFPFSENLDTIPLWCASGFKSEKKAIRLCDEEIS